MAKKADHLFKPGNTVGVGNRGNTRGRFLTSILIQQLHETLKCPETGKQREKMHLIVDALIKNALRGDNHAIGFIFDHVEGKLSQNVNVEHGFDLSRLTEKELDQFEHIARKATVIGGDGSPLPGSDTERAPASQARGGASAPPPGSRPN